MAPSLTSGTTGGVIDAARLGPATRLGPVHLAVTDLGRSVPFYERVIGLRPQGDAGQGEQTVALGVGGEDVLVLHEEPGARPAGRHSGLYHVALHYPTRLELARAGLRVAAAGVPIDGASDHGTHEAIYLPDPDGNGLELAADRPRDQWPDMRDPATYSGGPDPLDQRSLFSLVTGETPGTPPAEGITVGHLHLHVAGLAAGLAFYRDALGFDLVTQMGASAAFVSAGGYHHHVAFNTWQGEGAPVVPAGVVGLREWTLVVDGPDELRAVRERLQHAGVTVTQGPDSSFTADDPFGMTARVRAT